MSGKHFAKHLERLGFAETFEMQRIIIEQDFQQDLPFSRRKNPLIATEFVTQQPFEQMCFGFGQTAHAVVVGKNAFCHFEKFAICGQIWVKP